MSQLDLSGDLAPPVRQLGLLIGILEEVQGAAPSDVKAVLNPRWFEDPLKELGKIPSDPKRRDRLFEAINEIAPGRDGWHDLSGGTLFLVRRRDSLVGVGCRKALSFDRATATISLFLPLVDLKGGNPPVSEPLELKFAMEATGESIVQSLALSASLSFQGKTSVQLEVGLLRKGKRETLSLAKLLDHPETLVGLLTDLLVDQVGHQYPAAAQLLERLNSLLGIGKYGVFKGKAFFVELASEPGEGLKEWLSAVAGLIGSGAVTGAGTEADPYLLLLYPLGLAGGIHLTVGRSDANLRVGMKMTTDAARLTPGIGVQLGVELGLVQFRRSDLTPDFSKPVLLFDLALTNPATSRALPRPLFEYLPMHWIEGAPKEPFSIGSVHCGLRIEPGEAFDAARLPFLRLEDVRERENEEAVACDLIHGGREAIGVLECFGKALEVQYAQSRFNKSSTEVLGRDLGGLVEDGFALSAANSAFERFAKLAGTRGGIGGMTEALTGMARWLAEGDVERRLPRWLESQVAEGRIFEAAGDLLSLCSDSFYGRDGRLVFRAADEVELGLGGAGKTGIKVSLRAGYSMDALRFQVEGSLGILFSGGAPQVGLSAKLEPGQSALRSLERAGFRGRPEMRMALTPAGASGSVTVCFPGDELTVDLLPGLAWKRKAEAMAPEAWLLVLATRVLSELLEEKLLNHASVVEILDRDLGLGIVPGAVLVELRVLIKAGERYRFGSLSGIGAANVLDALLKSGQEEPPGKDGVCLLLRKNGTVSLFIRKELKGDARSLQLGRWLEGETDAGNWLGKGKKPGVELILGKKTDGSFRFQPGIELVSVGIDVGGAKGEALFSVRGVALHKFKARIHLEVGAGASAALAGALELNEFSMPLGPKVGGAGPGKNPVAANLLGDGGEDASGEPAENPAFSAVVSYVDEFKGRITGKVVPAADGTAWLPMNRSFGPLYCRKIGLGFDEREARLQVGYDGSVALSTLHIDLDRLTVGIPLKSPGDFAKYELGLAGMAVSFASGPVSVNGGLFRVETPQGTGYDGVALIKAQDFTITGFGSYALVAGAPSLFLFGVMHKDLGGPACFHVTGVAAGFGYNRALQLPAIEKVHEFPLVKAALDEKYISGSGQGAITEAMTRLREYLPPTRGRYWLAIGVRFSSFEMIQSFALLSVSFGADVEIGLLGMSTMTVPRDAKPGKAIAYAELALRAVIRPADGSIEVQGRLTDNSYLFAPACKLTGGFAFYTWFSGPHGGDFVLTLGGYHPAFLVPSHYPIVPRLAINWQVEENLRVSGEMYYALTPSCLMAGGKLSAVYKSGCIEAWFTAYANLLLNWKPFFYDVQMGISLGVACRVSIDLWFATITFSLRVTLGVDLHLWGPPFAGEVYVDLSIISFTIRFGKPSPEPQVLKPNEFVEAFLPPAKSGPSPLLQNSTPVADVLSLQIASGLIRQQTEETRGARTINVVNAHDLAFVAQSTVPGTQFTGLAALAKKPDAVDLSVFGVRPMGKQTLRSILQIHLWKNANSTRILVDSSMLRISAITTGVPDALWGKSAVAGRVDKLKTPGAKTLLAMVGIRVSCLAPEPEHALNPIPLERLKFENFDLPVSWEDPGMPMPISVDAKGFWSTIWGDQEVTTRRNQILASLGAQSPFVLNRPDLSLLAKARETYFQSAPTVSALGQRLE